MAMTYEEVLRRLGRRVSVQVDKRRGTEIRRAPGEAGEKGDIQVRYRGTPVVTFHPDRTYTLRTGGTASRTVRNRIAEYSPVSLVYRGGGYYIEDVKTGELRVFLEGAVVDARGTILGVEGETSKTTRLLESTPPGAGGGAMVDEAQFRAYVRTLVVEELRKMSPSGVTPLAVTPPASPVPGAVGAPVRAVRMRATVKPSPDTSVQQAGTVSLQEVEALMLAAGVDPKRIARVLRDNLLSRTRGRVPKAEAEDVPAPAADHSIPIHLCQKCNTDLVAHYDKANRYRGCEYALKHSDHVQLV